MLPDMTWEEVKDRARESDVAIVVTGANEQHGIHLPLKTDIFIATEIAKRGVELVKNDVKPIIAPPIPFGYSPEHQFFPGTIVINLNTFINLVKDVVRSLIKSGFNKIVIINGHGGNPPALMNVVGEIKQETDAFIVVFSWWELVTDDIYKIIESSFLHACELETSMILGLDFPVDMKKAIGEMPESPLTGFSEWDLNTLGLITSDVWGHFSISKTGAIGNPEKGTAEKGKKILNLAVKKFAQLLKVVNDKKLVKHYSNPKDRS